jgi:preprotein translocase subunit SecA
VRELGGLHVIGSERHEARRIDNQLRGRAARQGDPGSSLFYLSLDDELMRLFGGGQVEGLLKRLNIDESMPIESNMVGRLVEQSQTRVEGSNFDVRKHLLEYDDVLNSQRKRIYSQRDRVFTKDDLTEDVEEMLVAELNTRVPAALSDEEGPWKLLGYLDEIQPPLNYESIVYPTYTLRLLINDLAGRLPDAQSSTGQVMNALLSLAESSLEAEQEHLLRATHDMLTRLQETYEQQREERFEALDTFIEGRQVDDETAEPAKPQDVATELAALVRVPLRLSNDQLRRLTEGDEDAAGTVREQVDNFLLSLTIARAVSAVKRRLEEANLKPADFQGKAWETVADSLLDTVENVFGERKKGLLGENGQITRDLQPLLERLQGVKLGERELIYLLINMAQGTRVGFNSKTHQRENQRYSRLQFVYLAAKLLENRDPEDVREEVLEHLQGAEVALSKALGASEWNRLNSAGVTLGMLEEKVRARLVDRLGEEHFEELAHQPLLEFADEDRQAVAEVFGKRLQNEIYRQLLLNVVSQSWVEYLTKVDALRVSIGLEAFAQRDPLVQYKSQASEMFRQLLNDMRSGVVTRMFLTQPTRRTLASTGAPAFAERDSGNGGAPDAEPEPAQPRTVSMQSGGGDGKKKKRKRH